MVPKHTILSPSLPGLWTHSTRRPPPGTILTRHPATHSPPCLFNATPPTLLGFQGACHRAGDLPCCHPLPLPLLTAPWKPSVPITLQSNCLRPQPRAVTKAGSPRRPPGQGGGRSGPRQAPSDKGVNQGMKETFTSPSRGDQGETRGCPPAVRNGEGRELMTTPK